MYRARNIIAKATEGEMVSFITQDDKRALVTYDPVDCVMVISTRPKGSVLGASVTAFDFLEGGEFTKCKQHIQELISGANTEIVTPTNPLFSRFNEDHE